MTIVMQSNSNLIGTTPIPKWHKFTLRMEKSSKKTVLPYRYFVYAWANKRDARWYKGESGKVYKGETDKKYFQKYETAKAYAKKLWNGLSDTQKTHIYVTIGRFSDSYESISKDNPIKWLD